MKITKLCLIHVKYSWNCWVCGWLNIIDFSIYKEKDLESKMIEVECGRCKSKRKARRDFEQVGKESKELFDKIKRIEKRWIKKEKIKREEVKQKYIKELKQESKKKRRKKR